MNLKEAFRYQNKLQSFIKRETSLRIRRCRDVPAKGNYYRRLFDYWWTLY